MYILCVRVKINKRSFKRFVFGSTRLTKPVTSPEYGTVGINEFMLHYSNNKISF